MPAGSTYAYDAYGTTTASTGTVANPLRYAGQYQGAESGLYYLRARYYDPATQQFLTRDPLVAATEQAYNYAGGSPPNGSDPSGLMFKGADEYGGGGGGLELLLFLIKQVLDKSGVQGVTAEQVIEQAAEQHVEIASEAEAEAFVARMSAGQQAAQGLGRLAGREINVCERGIQLIEKHLSRPEFMPAEENEAMLARLRAALSEGRTISGADASFYLHELTEANLMDRGFPYEVAHAMAFSKYGVSQYSVYHYEVITQFFNVFNDNWVNFWRSQP